MGFASTWEMRLTAPIPRPDRTITAAVRGGLLSLDEACNRYTLSVEEFLSWQRAIDRYGVRGLRATRIQEYRNVAAE